MKIALCFSGAIRDFDTCIASIKKYLIQDCDTDIFLHLWEFKSDNDINHNFKWRKDTCSKDRIIKLLKPKSYVIDNYDNDWENKIISESGINTEKFKTDADKNYGYNCCSMYYKIRECFKLAEKYSQENNINYDLYIRARLDFIWEDYIKWDEFMPNKLYLIKDRYATQSKIVTNDKFFAGSYDIMKNMCNIFNYLKSYQDKNIQIEGQTINNRHILANKFDYTFIGHKNTYYKCMGRHKINYKNIKLIFNILDQNKNFIDEIAYYFLNNGYYVDYNTHSYNTYFINCNNLNFNGIEYNIKFNILDNYLVINFLDNIIKINNNLLNQHYGIFNFLLSLLECEIKNNTYQFDELKLINNIIDGEIIIYKYKDSGYYNLPIKIIDNCFYINFLNKLSQIDRNTFIIKKIYKYYSENILPY